MASNPTALREVSRNNTAAIIQRQLRAAEEHVDLSISNTGELLGKLIRAAEEGGLHRTKLHPTLVRAYNAIGFNLKAQWELQRAHQGCREHLDEIDTEVLGWGWANSPSATIAQADHEKMTDPRIG